MNHSNGPITDGEAEEDERNSLASKLLADVKMEVAFDSTTINILTSLHLNLGNLLKQ